MRGSVAAIVLACAAVAISDPADALSGPMPGSKLQNVAPTNVEQVVVVRRGGAVARGPRGGVAAVGAARVDDDRVAALGEGLAVCAGSIDRQGAEGRGDIACREDVGELDVERQFFVDLRPSLEQGYGGTFDQLAAYLLRTPG